MKSNVIIATAPCSWGVWYADGTPSGTPSAVFLEQAGQAGYRELELGPDGYLPADETVLREELAKNNLSIAAGTICWPFDQEADFEAFKDKLAKLCQRVKSLGGKYIVAMDESDVGQFSEKKENFSSQVWSEFLEKIRLLGLFAKEEYGLEVVWHPHIKSMIETEEEIVRLMNYTGLNLCLDTGHHAYANGTPDDKGTSVFAFMRKYAERITYLHFKNVDKVVWEKVIREKLDVHAAFGLDIMCDLKDGMIDFKELKNVLDEIQFNGIGVIEQDMPNATPEIAFAAAKRNLSYLKEVKMID